jgi:hypothetical protein
MARVRNVALSIGRVNSSTEFAEVSYDIEFSGAEVTLDLEFKEFVSLFERDDDLDEFYQEWGSNLGIQWRARGNLDDYIGVVRDGSIRPDGVAVHHRTHRREWAFPSNESGNEEYRALVLVAPEIYRGSGWSNEVSINLA